MNNFKNIFNLKILIFIILISINKSKCLFSSILLIINKKEINNNQINNNENKENINNDNEENSINLIF